MLVSETKLINYICKIYLSGEYKMLDAISLPHDLSFEYLLHFPSNVYDKLNLHIEKQIFITETADLFTFLIKELKEKEGKVEYDGSITLKGLEPKYNNPSEVNQKYRLSL